MNSSEVTAVDAGIVTKSNYRGNVQAIPFTLVITGEVNASHVISKVLPQETRVISAVVSHPDLGTGVTVDLGTSDVTNSIIDGASSDALGLLTYPNAGSAAAVSALGSIDVGGKSLVLTIAGADAASGGSGNEGTIDATIVGHVLIATNE